MCTPFRSAPVHPELPGDSRDRVIDQLHRARKVAEPERYSRHCIRGAERGNEIMTRPRL